MSLQELNHEDRIIFLMDFVEDLILQATKENQIKEIIAAEKIKRKYLQEKQDSSEFGATVIFGREEMQPQEKSQQVFGQLTAQPVKQNQQRIMQQKQLMPVMRRPPAQMQIRPQTTEKMNQELASLTRPQSPDTSTTTNSTDPLAKIASMIRDPNVQLIECPGTGKNVLVKVRNKINITQVLLSENEIKNIINYFASQANVPMIGGILKAAVGDMLISAVVSNYVGSRFILTKKSPYSLLEQ